MRMARQLAGAGGSRPAAPAAAAQNSKLHGPRSRLLLVEYGHAVPSGGRRIAALVGGLFRIQLVEGAFRVHAMEIEQAHIHLIPLARAVQAKRLVPHFDLVARPLVDFDVSTHGLVY